MQNYRTTPMPYHNYRPTSPSCSPAKHDCFQDVSLAMAYVPWQAWRDIYEAEKGFHCGTIFKELNLPFLGKGGVRR